MNLGIDGDCVTRVSFDFAITLHMDTGNELRLETDIEFRPAAGDPIHIIPALAQKDAELVLSLLNACVKTAVADAQSGELAIDFGQAGTLRVSTDGPYEAWTLASSHGLTYTAIAGGGLASWQQDDH